MGDAYFTSMPMQEGVERKSVQPQKRETTRR
nr:MAG TPA: hypothetical protein [Caudoviricetes sp.]